MLLALCAAGAWLCPVAASAEPVSVRFSEGEVHGYLSLHTLDGRSLADAELMQVARGDRVTSQIVWHFRDGSIQDETAVFSQDRTFRLVSDHLVQRGPAFPLPIEVWVDGRNGQVTVRYTEGGRDQHLSEHLDLPADTANGMIPTLLKNLPPGTHQLTVSVVATTPKPRLVKVGITPAGDESFAIGSITRQAIHYVLKVELGGLAGLLAPLVGKQPPDFHLWIQGGTAPGFLKSQGPLYPGGPIWVIQLASPTRPPASAPARSH